MTGYYLPSDIPNYDLVDGYDITVPGVLEDIFEKEKPDVVINLAAVTDVVGAEKDQLRCYQTNTLAAFHVAILCKKYDSRLIFVSSVDVFDGKSPWPYSPWGKKNPIVVYGHSKDDAEEMIQRVLPESLIIRAGWMFGGFKRDKKFVSYMMEQMLHGTEPIRAVTDIKGSPTYGKDLIEYILTQCYDYRIGVMHFCNEGSATRFDQAKVIATVLGYEGLILPATMEDFPKFRALKNSVMIPSVKTRPWQDALKEYIQLWKESIE